MLDRNLNRRKIKNVHNKKCAFRCWMLRLGFIGEEFKTARKLLLQNVSGNAFYGRLPGNRYVIIFG